ncbi:MAG TPA: IclR family transcriptional regulator [Phenylobacterium sp.]|nr:IclR family transcriptional regulator [Phenylobacterium sp.]
MSKIVERTLDFIELFAQQNRPLSMSEIARLLDIPLSSCHDVLQTLQARGYVTEVAPRGGYYPTMRLHALAAEIARGDPLAVRSQKALIALRDSLDETVSLGKRTGDGSGMHLMVLESSNRLRFHNTPGEQLRSIHATSAGKVILGELSPERFEAWLSKATLTPLTAHTIISKAKLREAIEAGRARGWFLNEEESAPGVTTIGAGFTWLKVFYFVTVAGPTRRMVENLDSAAAGLLATCKRLEDGDFS